MSTSENPLRQLRDLLDKRFDTEELRSLCFDLGVDYNNLVLEIKRTRFESLLHVVGLEGRGPDLIALVTKLRPRSDWPEPDWAAIDWQGLTESQGPPLVTMIDSGA